MTIDDVSTLVDAFMSATPTPPPSWWIESVWVGYAAIMSPEQSIVTVPAGVLLFGDTATLPSVPHREPYSGRDNDDSDQDFEDDDHVHDKLSHSL